MEFISVHFQVDLIHLPMNMELDFQVDKNKELHWQERYI